MSRLQVIANPVINPGAVIVSDVITQVSDSLLQEFKEYLGIVHNSEDSNLKRILLAILKEIARPTSVGLSMGVSVWSLRVELCGNSVVYLPRYNEVNFSVLNFDSSGNTINADWSLIGAHLRPGNLALMETETDPLPFASTFTYTVGFNEEDFPNAVKEMVFMWAGFRREFPLGVGDAGQDISELPRAVELVMDEWQMKTDLRGSYATA